MTEHSSNLTDTDNQNDLDQTLRAKAAAGQQLLSPWVQRQLSGATGSRGENPASSRHEQTALTSSGTASLLQRLQRSADRGRVWQPDVGSLNPLLVNNFTQSIIRRFPDTGSKYEPQSSTPALAGDTDLPLAGARAETPVEAETAPATQGPAALPFTLEEVRRALEGPRAGQSREIAPSSRGVPSGGAVPPFQRTAAEPQQPGNLPFSLAEVRAALEKPHFTQAGSGPSPSQVQRTGDTGRRRVVSRVEEVTPTLGNQPGLGSPEPDVDEPGGAPSLKTPAAPERVQRQTDEARPFSNQEDIPDVSTPPPASSVVEVVPFPTRPRRERPTIPPVQRQVAPEKATPASPEPPKATDRPSGKEIGPLESRPASISPVGEAPSAKVSSPQSGESTLQRQPETEGVESTSSSPSEFSATSPAENIPPKEVPLSSQSGSENQAEVTVQRQPALEMPLKEAPIPPTPPEEKQVSKLAQPELPASGDHPDSPGAKTSPAIQRQPESKSSSPPSPPSTRLTQPEPVVSPPQEQLAKGETTSAEQSEVSTSPETPSAPAEQAIVQRHLDAELPLKLPVPPVKPEEPALSESEPATGPEEGPPVVQRQAEPLGQRPVTTPATADPVSAVQPEVTRESRPEVETSLTAPIIQRQPEAELPLRLPPTPAGETNDLFEDIPPATAIPGPTSALQRQVETPAKPEQTSPIQPEAIPEQQSEAEPGSVGPAIQRQPEADLPLRLPPTPAPAEETDIPFEDTPLAAPTPRTAPALQRQVETPAKPELTSPIQPGTTPKQQPEADSGSVGPAIQRQPEADLPLRLPSTPAPAGAKEPEEVSTTFQPQGESRLPDEAPAKPDQVPSIQTGVSSQGLSEPEPGSTEPVVQRRAEEDLPLRFPPTPALAEETEVLETEQAAAPPEPSPAIQRQVDSPALTQTTTPPATQPEETSVSQDLPGIDLPLRRSTLPVEAAREVESGTPEVIPPISAEPAVQRQPVSQPSFDASTPAEPGSGQPEQAIEEVLPLRQPPLPTATPAKETGLADTSQPVSTEPLSDRLASEPVSGPEATRQVSAPPIQRQPEPDLPLRRLPSPGAETAEPVEGAASPVDLNHDIISRAEAGSSLPLTKPLSGASHPAIQRKPLGPMAVLPQARFNTQKINQNEISPSTPAGHEGGTPTPTPATSASTSLPLATPRRVEMESGRPGEASPALFYSRPGGPSTPAVTIQRQVASPAPEPGPPLDSSEIIQRIETETTPAPEGVSKAATGESPDLEKLARQILPEIKRLLARERDRLGR